VNALAPLSASAATAAPTEQLAPDEHEVTFTSGNDTIYGTLLLPNRSGKMPAALLLSGSGPTDRDGNNRLLPNPIDSHKIMARILADQGVASLRYDKSGTGKTGLGSYAGHPSDLDFDTYVNEARDGLKYLQSRSEIDPTRIMILGHSEGGLIAMLVANDRSSNVKALALVNSLSKPYLQTIHDQYQARLGDAIKAGTLTQAAADKIMSAIDSINRNLLSSATLPSDIPPEVAQIYNPSTTKFLASVGKYDPGKVAESLPNALPVLVTCGEKDIQVLCGDIPNVLDGFRRAGNEHVTFVQLKDTNHILREVQGGDPADYSDTSKPFSSQMKKALSDFVKASLLP
jgi:alpha-beta hydrolase superfamily lysophospholipase